VTFVLTHFRLTEGVFIGAHVISEGVLTRRRLREGPFVRVLHGVYADVSQTRDHLLKCRAAALLMPPGAVLAGRSAATVLGAPQPDYAAPVTVIVPDGVQWAGPAGVRARRVDLPTTDVVLRDDGLHHTTPLRTAWDVAATETTATAVGVVDAMLRADTIDEGGLRAMVEDGAGRWGVSRVRRAFDLTDRHSHSPPESWVRVACALAGLPAPVPQFHVWEHGVKLGEVDLAWPEQRVIVEYEGEYHFDGVQIVKDDGRYARLVAAGWTVIRVAAHDLRDMPGLVRRIADALGEAVR
jgi:hypothetical protein